MCARSIRMMLLATILLIVASAMEMSACEHMSPPGSSIDQVGASPTERVSRSTAIAKDDAAIVARWDFHDIGGGVPRCCQTDVCCHFIATSSLPGLWAACGDEVVASLSTDGTVHSAEPDVPPPKAVRRISHAMMSFSRPETTGCAMLTTFTSSVTRRGGPGRERHLS
jgi:hypothetical protein